MTDILNDEPRVAVIGRSARCARHVIDRLLDLSHVSWRTCGRISCRLTRAIGHGDGGTSWLSAGVITGWPCSR
jgi:hypothetical protein